MNLLTHTFSFQKNNYRYSYFGYISLNLLAIIHKIVINLFKQLIFPKTNTRSITTLFGAPQSTSEHIMPHPFSHHLSIGGHVESSNESNLFKIRKHHLSYVLQYTFSFRLFYRRFLCYDNSLSLSVLLSDHKSVFSRNTYWVLK